MTVLDTRPRRQACTATPTTSEDPHRTRRHLGGGGPLRQPAARGVRRRGRAPALRQADRPRPPEGGDRSRGEGVRLAGGIPFHVDVVDVFVNSELAGPWPTKRWRSARGGLVPARRHRRGPTSVSATRAWRWSWTAARHRDPEAALSGVRTASRFGANPVDGRWWGSVCCSGVHTHLSAVGRRGRSQGLAVRPQCHRATRRPVARRGP